MERVPEPEHGGGAGETEAAEERGSVPPEKSRDVGRVLLAILTVVIGVGALKLASTVTLPLAFSLFLIALFWPTYSWFQRALPAGVAAVLTLLTFLAAIGVIVGGLYFSAEVVGRRASEYRDELGQMVEQATSWARARSVPVPELKLGGEGSSLSGPLARGSKQLFDFFGASVLVVAFLGLGLLEVCEYRERLLRAAHSPERGQRWISVVHRIAHDFQRYIIVRTGIGIVTGVGTGLVALLIGLDFAFIWGLINFLLNYVPTLGSIIGVVPPVLFALVQFQSFGMAGLVLLGVGGVQLAMGNYIDPLLQGRYLRLSPFVVLLSVVFWGWVWGVAGAFISVPMTIFIVLVCKQFESTRWIAEVLAQLEDGDGLRASKR